MPTAAERQALAFLGVVALLGGGARAWQYCTQREPIAASREAISNSSSRESVGDQLAAIDSARSAKRGQSGKGKRSSRKPVRKLASGSEDANSDATNNSNASRAGTARGNKRAAPNVEDEADVVIDVDFATAEELERLPHIGPAMAARIVANRDSLGYFGSLAALGRIRGLGESVRKGIANRAVFSGIPRRPPSGAAPVPAKAANSHPHRRKKK